MEIPKIKLNSGYEIPQLGLGVYQAHGAEVTLAIKWAFNVRGKRKY